MFSVCFAVVHGETIGVIQREREGIPSLDSTGVVQQEREGLLYLASTVFSCAETLVCLAALPGRRCRGILHTAAVGAEGSATPHS